MSSILSKIASKTGFGYLSDITMYYYYYYNYSADQSSVTHQLTKFTLLVNVVK